MLIIKMKDKINRFFSGHTLAFHDESFMELLTKMYHYHVCGIVLLWKAIRHILSFGKAFYDTLE